MLQAISALPDEELEKNVIGLDWEVRYFLPHLIGPTFIADTGQGLRAHAHCERLSHSLDEYVITADQRGARVGKAGGQAAATAGQGTQGTAMDKVLHVFKG